MSSLAVRRSGNGPPVLLVHGGLRDGEGAWKRQRGLAERWTLIVPDRVGYGGSASLGDGEDFERDAQLLAADLHEPTHVVGHSSGALAALLAAVERPTEVASLTVIEPPAFQVAPDSPAARRLVALSDELWDRTDEDAVTWLKRFFAMNGDEPPPDEVLEKLAEPARVWRRYVRRPFHGPLPLDAVAEAPFPKLVVSGGHSQAFEDVCDAMADRIGAEREVIPGEGHEVPRTGEPFNQRLEAFLRKASGT
jgi:pimeloyl-ACP methyl ester carboxylesterase